MRLQGPRANRTGASRHPAPRAQEIRQEQAAEVRGSSYHRLLPRHCPLRRLHQRGIHGESERIHHPQPIYTRQQWILRFISSYVLISLRISLAYCLGLHE